VTLEREREGEYKFGEGYAGGVYQGSAGEMEGYGYVYVGGPGADSVDTNISRMYEVVEHADGWDVVHEGRGVHGWAMEGMGMSMSWAIARVSVRLCFFFLSLSFSVRSSSIRFQSYSPYFVPHPHPSFVHFLPPNLILP
jgi:hypothetical protein